MMIYQINESYYKEHRLGLYSLNTNWYDHMVDIEADLKRMSM